MAETAAARAAEQLAEQARKFVKTKDAVADALNKNLGALNKNVEDGVESARRAYNRSREAAIDAIDDTERLIKRRPFEAIGTTLAVGFLAGLAVGLLVRRK